MMKTPTAKVARPAIHLLPADIQRRFVKWLPSQQDEVIAFIEKLFEEFKSEDDLIRGDDELERLELSGVKRGKTGTIFHGLRTTGGPLRKTARLMLKSLTEQRQATRRNG